MLWYWTSHRYFYHMIMNVFRQNSNCLQSEDFMSLQSDLILFSNLFPPPAKKSLSSDRCSEAGEHRLFVDKTNKIWAIINGLSRHTSPRSWEIFYFLFITTEAPKAFRYKKLYWIRFLWHGSCYFSWQAMLPLLYAIWVE